MLTIFRISSRRRFAGNSGFLVGKTCYQDGFCEGQRKGCERHKVFGSSKALLLISVPQVDFGFVVPCSCQGWYLRGPECASSSLWCVCWHPLFQVPLLFGSCVWNDDRFSDSLLRPLRHIWDPGGSCFCLCQRACCSLGFTARACSGTSDRVDHTHC